MRKLELTEAIDAETKLYIKSSDEGTVRLKIENYTEILKAAKAFNFIIEELKKLDPYDTDDTFVVITEALQRYNATERGEDE